MRDDIVTKKKNLEGKIADFSQKKVPKKKVFSKEEMETFLSLSLILYTRQQRRRKKSSPSTHRNHGPSIDAGWKAPR